jgi:tetratricopeptide (TPR) repeat protein
MSDPRFEEARALYRQGNPREALETIEESLAAKDAAELSDVRRYDLTVLKSHCLSALGNWKEAATVLDSIEPDRIDQEGRVRLAMHKGYLMGSLARYAECWTLLHTAEKGAQELGAEQLRGEVLWRRGMISIFVREHESAERNLSCALEIARTEKDRQLEALIKAGLAKNLMYQREDVKAIARFQEAQAIFEELGAGFYVATARGEMGTCYLHLGETAKALELLEESAAAFQANGSLSNYQVSLADIGGVYLAQGEYVKAISYYQRALELARQLGDRLSVSKWLRNLADAYLLLGSPAFARKFEVEADLLSKALTEERKRGAHVADSLMSHVPAGSSLHLRSRAS